MWLVRFLFQLFAVSLTATMTGVWGVLGLDHVGAGPIDRPPACQVPQPPSDPSAPPPELRPTTVITLGQAYYCIFDNHFSGPVLDSRTLLVPAFAALTQELQRRGLDQSNATLPALIGKKDQDWAAFSQVYEQIADRLQDPSVRQAIAEATMRAMLASLNDNHAGWQHGFRFVDFTGMRLSAFQGPALDPVATEPVFVINLLPDGPAERAGIRLGDEIVALNDVPPYINGVLTEGALKWITDNMSGTPLRLTLHRPVTDATLTVTMTPPPPPAPGDPPPPPLPPPGEPPPPPSKLVDGNIAYVMIPGFFHGVADQVLAAIAELRRNTPLHGVILDLRGNGGGSPDEVFRLLGAFTHGAVVSYWCNVRDHCTANRTDDSVPLLNLRLVALTDRNCASACDAFSSAVKDLHLGTLVGTRTAGVVAGPGVPYLLEDGSLMSLPKFHELAANREVINGIGVAPDYHVPLTAADLSAGRDPGLARAVALLR